MIKGLLKIVAGSLLVMAVVLGLSFMSLQAAGAQSPQEAACFGSGGQWVPNTKTPTAGDMECKTPNDDRTVSGTLSQVGNILIFVTGAVSVLMIIIGGIRYALAQGDSNSVNSAKNTIIYAVVGLVISLGAYGIVNFVTSSLLRP